MPSLTENPRGKIALQFLNLRDSLFRLGHKLSPDSPVQPTITFLASVVTSVGVKFSGEGFFTHRYLDPR
ncbi:hypothetical protein A2379_03390 [Candidatus Amesbacteria bacterium RIFOXYB1_FULL_47_13]|nr:MAG: hypothetical protein A2379_03390 [Candidatus Amesbacteria bacterium RIFOXYB1_FULL_47_13]HBC72296.1 hypothetical protein [Candidatus Amesbacteria bacterium]